MVAFDFPRTLRDARPHTLARISDGDTPVVDQPVRMVSVDTPEKAEYAGLPPTGQAKLDRCRQRLQDGTYQNLPEALRTYLVERLTQDAAERHINAGIRASQEFQALLDRRLTRPDGARRKVATVPTGELIDRYGRLLAYRAPWLSGSASDPLSARDDPQRRTFNLDMVEAGWRALFLIYSLPQNDDLNLLLGAAQAAGTVAAAPGPSSARPCCWAMSIGPVSSSACSSWTTRRRRSPRPTSAIARSPRPGAGGQVRLLPCPTKPAAVDLCAMALLGR